MVHFVQYIHFLSAVFESSGLVSLEKISHKIKIQGHCKKKENVLTGSVYRVDSVHIKDR